MFVKDQDTVAASRRPVRRKDRPDPLRQHGRARLTLLGILVTGVALLAVLEGVRRNGLYWFDVGQDYRYEFAPGASSILPVVLDSTGFTVGRVDGGWNTAVLAIEVTSKLSGYWFEPCIEIGSADQAISQCFERGARGRRYVVIHATDLAEGGAVPMRGRHLRWTVGETDLRTFADDDGHGEPLLVLAPHPDDAEIAAFGLYASHTSYVATMTAGNYVDGLYSDLALSETAQDTLRGEVRTWDSLVVPLWGGVPPERTVNLGYATLSLSRFHERQAGDAAAIGPADAIDSFRQGAVELIGRRAATADWNSLVADLTALLRAIRPTVIATPHPMLDAHPDHQYTTLALLQALAATQDTSTTLLLYTNHLPGSESFPFGPSNARVTLPPAFDPSLAVPAVYSFPLDPELQLRKLFALDAMHDLRGPPVRLTGGPGTVLATRVRQAWELIRRDPFGDYSYYRRAVRPNELFLVYRAADRPALIAHLDEHFPPRP